MPRTVVAIDISCSSAYFYTCPTTMENLITWSAQPPLELDCLEHEKLRTEWVTKWLVQNSELIKGILSLMIFSDWFLPYMEATNLNLERTWDEHGMNMVDHQWLLLIALHSCQPWKFKHLHFNTVCWPQFPFLSSGRVTNADDQLRVTKDCYQIHIGSGSPAPLGHSSLPLRYINFYHSIFEFHINFLHSIFIYTSTCSPSSLGQRSLSSRQFMPLKQHSGPMAKPGSPAAASQAAGSTALDGGITKDSFIPLFHGQSQSY